ncbi:MAG: hypothetical protein KC417_14485, partial [Myxococcales bacterium]|nr:hypothetical protein [Myxococcales bacterium]
MHTRRGPADAMTPGASEDAFEATVEEVVFTSDDGAFAVVHGKRASDEVRVTLVGDLAGFAPGETVRVRGRWTEHAVYGRRFRATAVTPILPSTQTGIARYLGSGLVPGIGPALAERLVERFGERTLDIIANESARLRDVEGIGAKRAASIAEAVRSRRDEAETLAYLHSVEIGPALGRRILKRLGPDTMHEVRTNPYGVAERVAGMGFRTADRVGRAQGIGPDDPRRAEGAALHVVAASADDGHTYLDAEALLERA